MQDLQPILDLMLGVLLTLGCALSLPIYWWLFVTPFVSLWNQYRARKAERSKLPQ
ncbi:MAG: hypothetical protein WCS99_11930 [Limisphaerales bacterium]